jgi:uncharacterized protein YndB with AHSA1/START domain
MNRSAKRLEIRVSRVIPTSAAELFDAWLDPHIPGNPWNAAERFLLDPRVDGLFYWTLKGTSHYGRFMEFSRPTRLRHTWVSPGTLGEESTVMVTFETQGTGTLMTLVHSDLPDHERAKSHEKGWTYFLDIFHEQFGSGSHRPYRWDDAHSSVKE